jgi:putative flippase GtrA
MSNRIEIRAQLIKFLITGAVAATIDFSFYYALFYILRSVIIAKGISFIIATTSFYFVSKKWTFYANEKSHIESFPKFLGLYAITLSTNVGLNAFFFHVAQYNIVVSYIGATAVSASMNFIGQKWWVFNKKSQ